MRKPTRRWLIGLAVLCLIASLPTWLFWDLPDYRSFSERLFPPSIRILDRNGRTLYELIGEEGGRHAPVPLEKIPEALKLATIATEDRNFYHNSGVDFEGVVRALWINLRGGETLAGGSTITQQVARNLLLSEEEKYERTLRRKIRESWLAWRLSSALSKDEILALYLNQMNYGGLSYGVEAASQTYFGKSVEQLTLAEAALIAGIPQAPALYNPLLDPAAAKNRQEVVLELMRKAGFISEQDYTLALRQPLAYSPTPYPIEAPHFVMLVSAQLDEILSEPQRHNQSLVVRTSLNLNLQHLAEAAVARQLQALRANNPGEQGTGIPGGHNVNNAALVALDPRGGDILALVGSPDYFDASIAGAINMAVAPRQPGSALKPLVYAAAFDPQRPQPFTPATMILDVRTTFTTHDGKAYTPANFDNLEHGPVSAREALASSLNIPAVITLEAVGVGEVIELASKLGITTLGNPDDYDLSLALGGGAVPLLELAAAYGALASSGFRLTPVAILEISTLQGEILYRHPPPTSNQVIDERVAWLVSDILNDNQARTPGFGPHSALRLDRPAAVKTGTTTNFHDNWTIGYTPDLVAGVWVGNANHEPMRGVTGLSGAAPIWHQFMREALTGTPEHWFERPGGLIQVEVCALSGMLPSQACPYTRWEWFIQGTEPTDEDTVFQRLWVNRRTGLLASEDTPPEDRIPITALNLPPGAHPWARKEGIVLVSDLTAPPVDQWAEHPLQIVAPGENTVFRINPDLPLKSQRIHIQATSQAGIQQVSIWLDGRLLATFEGPPFEFWWELEEGEHTLWAQGLAEDGTPSQSPVVHFRVER